MIITNRETGKWYLNPKQGARATWIDEIRLLEEVLDNPLALDKYKLNPYGDKFMYTVLMNYAYTVLRLRGNDVKDYMFNTMREIAIHYNELKPNKLHDKLMNDAFDDYYSYGKKVCYGLIQVTTDDYKDRAYRVNYKPLTLMTSQKYLNVWEFLMGVRPQHIEDDIPFYVSEINTIVELFGHDFNKLLIAFHTILRAKLFESSRLYWESQTFVDEVTGEVVEFQKYSDAKHWNTPCVRERFSSKAVELGQELGIKDRRGLIKVYNEVLNTMFENGLFINTGMMFKTNGTVYSGITHDSNVFTDCGYGHYEFKVKQFDKKSQQVRTVVKTVSKQYLQSALSKSMVGTYKPTFLSLNSNEPLAFTINYYDLTHGYVFNFIEYLVKNKVVTNDFLKQCKNGYRIKVCKECGKRYLVILDGSKQRVPIYCEVCGSPQAIQERKNAQRKAKYKAQKGKVE